MYEQWKIELKIQKKKDDGEEKDDKKEKKDDDKDDKKDDDEENSNGKINTEKFATITDVDDTVYDCKRIIFHTPAEH